MKHLSVTLTEVVLTKNKGRRVEWHTTSVTDTCTRLAEFVYNSIETLGDRRSVQDALRNLGLQG